MGGRLALHGPPLQGQQACRRRRPLQRGAPQHLGRPQLGPRRRPRLARRLPARGRPHPDRGQRRTSSSSSRASTGPASPSTASRTAAPPWSPPARSRTPSSTPASSSTPPTSTTTRARTTAAPPGWGRRRPPLPRPQPPHELTAVLNRQAFFVTAEQDQHFTAPLWISEFGVGGREETGTAPRAWFENFVDQLIAYRRRLRVLAARRLARPNRRGNGWALLHWDTVGRPHGRATTATTGGPPRGHRLIERPGRTGPVARRASGRCSAPTTATSSPRCVCARCRRLGLRRPQGRLPRRTAPPRPQPHGQPGPVLRCDRRRPVGPGRRARGGPGRAARPAGRRLGLRIHQTPVPRRPLPHRLQRPRRRRLGRPVRAGPAGKLGTAGRTVWFDRGDDRRPATPRAATSRAATTRASARPTSTRQESPTPAASARHGRRTRCTAGNWADPWRGLKGREAASTVTRPARGYDGARRASTGSMRAARRDG